MFKSRFLVSQPYTESWMDMSGYTVCSITDTVTLLLKGLLCLFSSIKPFPYYGLEPSVDYIRQRLGLFPSRNTYT